jgi:membrane-bound metal-dependent hydrolase YbcI (DUF457 family)
MMGRSGVNTAVVAWAYAAPAVAPDWRAFVLGFPLAAIASYGPDIEHAGSTAARVLGRNVSKLANKSTGGHRGGMHSAPMVLGAAAFAGWLLYDTQWCAWCVGIAWACHIFTDLLTKRGVALFWPLGTILGFFWKPLRVLDHKVRIAWFTTGGTGEFVYNVLVLLLGGYILIDWLSIGMTFIAERMV